MRRILALFAVLASLTLFGQKRIVSTQNSLFTDTQTNTTDYITYIESAVQDLSIIRSSARMGFKVISIRNDLPETDTTIKIMRESLQYSTNLDIRDLQMFEILIKDVQKKLARYKRDLDSAHQRIQNAADRMEELRSDSIWKELQRDTTALVKFSAQLQELRTKWHTTDSTMRSHSNIVESLTIRVANNTIVNSELLDKIDNLIRKLSQRSFQKEQHFLWEKAPAQDSKANVKLSAEKYYRAEKEAVWFYIKESSGVRVLMLVVGILFYWWVRKNVKNLRELGRTDLVEKMDLKYLSDNLILSTLVVVLNLSPLFDLTPPAIYISFMQFLLMLVLTWVFYRKWPRSVFYKWSFIVVLFILLSSTHLISTSSVWVRYWFLVLTIASVGFGVFFLIQQIKTKEFPYYVRWVTGIYILFNVLACLFNLYGRWTIAQLFGSSAIFGLSQIIGLSVFVHICIEAFTLNIYTARQINGLQQAFDIQPFLKNLGKGLGYVMLLLWVMVLASNLNIYNFLYDRALAFLSTPRTIGSVTFNIGSLVLFFLIIWISSTLQKYISFLFGDSNEEISKVNKRKHSKLLLLRLLLLTVGFLLAVAASGLPVDKITIIIGALGVGIGLGLQNIVNNFVSGVILIFERPFQVGDSIEIGARKGRVREIGIRHSILLTPEGGEVIVPNGDMLSNQILNWTLSNNYIRLEIPLKIETKENWQAVNEVVTKLVESDDRVLPTREPLILLNNINANLIDFKVLVWCKDFYYADRLKSELMEQLYAKFKEMNISTK